MLLVTGGAYRGHTGVRRATQRLVTGLRQQGVELGLLAHGAEQQPGVHAFPLPYPAPPDAERHLRRAIQHFQPDAMHVLYGGIRLMLAAQRAAHHGKHRDHPDPPLPWAITTHNVPPMERVSPRLHGCDTLHYAARNLTSLPSALAWRWFLKRGNFQRAVCHSQHVIAVTRRAGCPAHKLTHIPLGCDPPEVMRAHEQPSLFEPDDTPRIVSVGGLAHNKGFHDYLRVVARLRTAHPNLRYLILGENRDPTYRRLLQRTIRKLGLQAHCRIAVGVSEAQRIATARDADLYVVPSHEEGFCLSFMEGAMLTPRALGTAAGEMPHIVGTDPALRIVTPRDIDALIHTTRDLLALRPAADAVQRRRAELPLRYAWEAHHQAHVAMYRAMTQDGALAHRWPHKTPLPQSA